MLESGLLEETVSSILRCRGIGLTLSCANSQAELLCNGICNNMRSVPGGRALRERFFDRHGMHYRSIVT